MASSDYRTPEDAYFAGRRDGAMSVLAPALGVEITAGTPTHTLMGCRFNVKIEWIDEPTEDELDAMRQMAQSAQDSQETMGP